MFDLKRVLETAQTIELRAVEFYREAERIVEDPDARAALGDLAVMEGGHGSVFDRLLAEWADIPAGEEDPESEEYLAAIAENHILLSPEGPAGLLHPHCSVRDVLRVALQAEFASIAFFMGIIEKMPEGPGRDRVRAVLMEEQEHVVQINKRIIALATTPRRVV